MSLHTTVQHISFLAYLMLFKRWGLVLPHPKYEKHKTVIDNRKENVCLNSPRFAVYFQNILTRLRYGLWS